MITRSKSKVNLPDGTYNGYWGGYVVQIVGGEFDGYKFDVNEGIRTPRAHAVIVVLNSEATVEYISSTAYHNLTSFPKVDAGFYYDKEDESKIPTIDVKILDIIHTTGKDGESVLLWVRKVEYNDEFCLISTYNSDDVFMNILARLIDGKIYATELTTDNTLRKLDWISIYRKID